MATFSFPDQGSRPSVRPADRQALFTRHLHKTNTDGRKTVPGGGKANFIVYYHMDDEEAKHFLSLESYGVDDRWVLLKPVA